MDLMLRDKKALVLAASKGIGKGVAAALAHEGCHVLIASSNKENLNQAKRDLERTTGAKKIETYVMDVSSMDSIQSVSKKILQEHQRIDILVTNSPGPEPLEAATIDEEKLNRAIRTNLLSVISLCKIFLPPMVENRFGRIINLSSTTGKEPDSEMVLSNVTRAGVLAYCKTLSREVAGYGITVNSILTGGVETDRTVELRRLQAKKAGVSYEELARKAGENFPVGFVATPEQFSHTIAFLASPLSMYINGVSLPVDGGLMKGI